MTENELFEIIEKHKRWLDNEDGGEMATLQNADLSGLRLDHVDLQGVNFINANLQNIHIEASNFRHANFSGANLGHAFISKSDFSCVNFQHTILKNVIAFHANFHEADFRYANLQNSYLRGNDFTGANLDYSAVPLCHDGFGWITDNRIMAQLAYHFCSMECDDKKIIKYQNKLLRLANKFHMIEEGWCLKLYKK
jgi:hypothetical protein